MGWYGNHVVPRLVNTTCGITQLEPLRRRVCAEVQGRVVEIGFGSGLNLPFYSGDVTEVAAIEPADLGWKLAADRIARSPVPVVRSGLDGQSLPFPDNTFDAAVSTFTMCTIPDVDAALAEVRRVLRPGGTLHFVEHGLAPDTDVQRWQRRFEPVQRTVAGGCHLTRDIPALVRSAGFDVRDLDAFYQDGVPRMMGALSVGVAAA